VKREDIIPLNENLKTVCKHLQKFEEKDIDINSDTTSTTTQFVTNPLFKPQELIDNTNLGYSPKLVKELGEKLSSFQINALNEDSESNSSDDEEIRISQIQDQFVNNT